MNSKFGVSIGRVFIIVDLINRTCTCKAWKMFGIPRKQFSKDFMILACATILVPNTKHEGIRDIWDQIWDGDLPVQRN